MSTVIIIIILPLFVSELYNMDTAI